MTYIDALSRIGQIEQQLAQLSGASATSTTGSSALTGATATGHTAAAGATTFAGALASAQGATVAGTGLADASAAGSAAQAGQVSLASLSGGLGLPATGSAALPSAATTMLTSDQQQFASRLAADTGLNPGVICAWLMAEENGSAATSRQAASNNDWLNIGYTGSGTYGSSDSVWSDPTTAADATAGWIKGQNTIPGYGTASSGIQSILSTVGQSPSAQLSAIQSSGWAGSGYPDLPGVYAEVAA